MERIYTDEDFQNLLASLRLTSKYLIHVGKRLEKLEGAYYSNSHPHLERPVDEDEE